MDIELTKEQEQDIIETLTEGGTITFQGKRFKLATWTLEERERKNPFTSKQENMVFNSLTPMQSFDRLIKSLYKSKHNL